MSISIPSTAMSRVARLHAIAEQHFGGRNNIPVNVLALIRNHQIARLSPVKFAQKLSGYSRRGDDLGFAWFFNYYSRKNSYSCYRDSESERRRCGRVKAMIWVRECDRRRSYQINKHLVARLGTQEIQKLFEKLDKDTIQKYGEYLKICAQSHRPTQISETKKWQVDGGAQMEHVIPLLLMLANEVDPKRTHEVPWQIGNYLDCKKGDTAESILARFNEREQNPRIKAERAAFNAELDATVRSAVFLFNS